MPEHDKERAIDGKITITPSSDAAIVAKINSLSLEIGGLPDPEVIIDGDQLPPKLVGTIVQGSLADEIARTKIVVINSKLTPKHSAVGSALRTERLRKLKKAA